MALLVIAAYHCEVAGRVTDSVDYQVRYFESDCLDAALDRLRAEPPQGYSNPMGESVRWLFDDTVAVEVDPAFTDGAEIIGFITGKPSPITEPGGGENAG